MKAKDRWDLDQNCFTLMPQALDLNFYYILGTNTQSRDWTMCRARGFAVLGPQWNAASKRLSQGSGRDAEEEVEKL